MESIIIAEQLRKCVEAERRDAVTAARKVGENGLSNNKTALESVDCWKGRAEVILEFVQGMKNLTETKTLLPALFKILKM